MKQCTTHLGLDCTARDTYSSVTESNTVGKCFIEHKLYMCHTVYC